MSASTPDTILNFLVVILPTALSVLGCFMTPGFLPPKYKWWWRGGLVALGITISGLTLWQQSRTSAQNETAQRDLRESLRNNELSNQYLRGQLDTISKVLGQVAANQGRTTVDNQFIAALTNVTRQTIAASDARSALEKMSNKILREKVLEFSKQMIEWSGKMEREQRKLSDQRMAEMSAIPRNDNNKLNATWHSWNQKDSQLSNKFQLEFKRNFLGVATSFRDELLRRLGPQPPPSREERPLALDGWIAPMSVDWTASYLDKLARKLPG